MKTYKDKVTKGTYVELDGNEMQHAMRVYLYALGVILDGPSTIRVVVPGGKLGPSNGACIYVDPSGRVVRDGEEIV